PAARAPTVGPSAAAVPPPTAPVVPAQDSDVESNTTIRPPRRSAPLVPGFRSRPPFRTWLRDNWLDILTILLCALAALLIYLFVSPIMPRYFPLYPGIETSAWGRRYGQPLRPEYITTLTSALLSYLVPAAIMGAIALWGTRNFSDGNAALIGLGYALATATLFQALIKVFIGGLRPHFFDVCRPTIPATLTYYQADRVCTSGTKSQLNEAQMSFPSGHACAAFAGFGFLALYFNAKYKVFGHGRRSNLSEDAAAADTTGRIQHWKLILFALPWLVALLLSLSKIRDG
ncbi:PAP2-domain-containing protein, partial [Plenodomus tracheiphilus IPT5]